MFYHAMFAAVVIITALSMFINEQFLKLPKTIALTIISVSLSILITLAVEATPLLSHPIHALLISVDFKTTVLDIMLGYLLFANSLHINTVGLKKHFSMIFYLASFGVVTSTIITGFILWKISLWLHFPLSFADCLIFGALIAPTDPIAVSAILTKAKNVPERIRSKIMGESLLNDAAGILVLVILVRFFYTNDINHITPHVVIHILLQEAVGGIILGLILGFVSSFFLAKTHDAEVSILLTLATVSGGYILANRIEVSGVIAMVVAGLIVGNLSKQQKISNSANLSLIKFWDLVDGILNAFLFVLVGLEMLTINVHYSIILGGVIGIGIVFIARFLSMLLPSIVLVDRKTYPFRFAEVLLLSWGGIRGAISIALGLSIPSLPSSLVAITYCVVIFSIVMQGSSFGWLVNKVYPAGK